MEVAECKLSDLLTAYASGNVAKVDTMVDLANDQLEKSFRAVWKQSAISVVMSVKDQQLYVQVRNADKRRTSFSERSDGLRQFVALQCFMTSRGESDPNLLIDEAEQHLHYDAQADLIQMLVSQTVATKVIYTTHSAGCLPEDLGNGVRLVEPEGPDEEWSRVRNKFWDSKQSTLSPLLIGMGASTLAFFPTRVAVVVEGEADMLLYPSMIRDALGSSTSGMQFVPGLSRIDKQQLPMLNTVGTRVCFLVDDDSGGRALVDDLTRMGINRDRVFRLTRPGKGDVELEDLIDSDMLALAVNELTRRHFQNSEVVPAALVPKYGKWDFVVARCAEQGIPPLLKVDVAYAVLDQLASDPKRRLLDVRLRENLAQVAQALRVKLRLVT
jgi:predicted ATP-dependent endonuclease of OLD family